MLSGFRGWYQYPSLSLGEMKELGFGLWNNESQLRLIPLWMVPYLNGNTEVLSISGGRCKLHEADNDKIPSVALLMVL